jgi:hypothetical protein
MYNRHEIEGMILGMADLVAENKFLRNKLSELELSVARDKALSFGKDDLYEKLKNRIDENLSYNLVRSSGWMSNHTFGTLDDMGLTKKEYEFCRQY